MTITHREYNLSKLSKPFQTLLGNKKLMWQAWDVLPNPIEMFNADGLLIYANRAALDVNGIPDAGLVVEKYNVLNDPVLNDRMGMREYIQKAFSGEAVAISDFSAPIDDLVDRGVIKEKPYEAMLMDIDLVPVFDDARLAYVIGVFVVKRTYQDNPKIAKVKEYMDSHWQEKFDAHAIAKAVGISYSSMAPLFKQHEGMTLNEYYLKVKIEYIKEQLADPNLSVKKAFAACGADSQGEMAKTFKKLTGMKS